MLNMRRASGFGAVILPGEKLLPGTMIITNAVAVNMGFALRLTPEEAIAIANTEIAQKQRFYRQELEQAAGLLAQDFPPRNYYGEHRAAGADAGAWRIMLKNGMGWRIVPYAGCRADYVIDPVTKECKAPYIPPPPPDPDPYVEPLPEPYLKKAGMSPWIIGGGIAALVVLTMGKR